MDTDRSKLHGLIACIALLGMWGCVELDSADNPIVIQTGLTSDEIPTFEEVEPILMERCTPCHVGEQLNDCPSTCFATFYEALAHRFTCCSAPFTVYEEPPTDCKNLLGSMTIAECGYDRVIHFERDGKDLTIRPGTGAETGFKWLADKENCLIVVAGQEGYCR